MQNTGNTVPRVWAIPRAIISCEAFIPFDPRYQNQMYVCMNVSTHQAQGATQVAILGKSGFLMVQPM